MAASCRPHMTWRFASPHALVASPESRIWANALVGAELVVRGETCRARRRLVGDAAIQPRTGRFAVRVLTKIYMPSLRHNARWRVFSFLML
jgi:hypothetical protein